MRTPTFEEFRTAEGEDRKTFLMLPVTAMLAELDHLEAELKRFPDHTAAKPAAVCLSTARKILEAATTSLEEPRLLGLFTLLLDLAKQLIFAPSELDETCHACLSAMHPELALMARGLDGEDVPLNGRGKSIVQEMEASRK